MKIQPIVPTTLEECWEQAKRFLQVPFIKNRLVDEKRVATEAEVFFVIMLGLELGLTPAQALQNITIIKGRPTVWGDVLLSLVYSSGLLKKHSEVIKGSLHDGTAKCVCTVQRVGFDPQEIVFSVEDAKRAGLWKYGTTDPRHQMLPWVTYPLRMLTMRARTFALRNSFADVIKGLTSREEARDIPDDKKDSPNEIKEVKNEVVATKDGPKKNTKNASNKTKEETLEIYTSDWFKEKYLVDSEGSYHLESGAVYTLDEVKKIQKLDSKEKKKYHTNKLESLPESNLFTSMVKSQEAVSTS